MKLQYFGHSCFRIISEMGTTILCDPYDDETLTRPMTHIFADVVTLSHNHHDHNAVQNLLNNPAVLDVEIACAADDVAVKSYSTFHDEQGGALRGSNLVFTFNVDGLSVVHLGDIGFVDESIVDAIKGCNALLLPVGGVYTVDAVAAKKIVDQVKPSMVIPMHYATPLHTFKLNSLGEFTQLFPSSQVRLVGDTLLLEDMFSDADTQVVVMQPYFD